MSASNTRLVLMPGLDGTGELFASLRAQLLADLDVVTVRYPQDRPRSYKELRSIVIEACEGFPSVALFAESFSSPLAIEIAALGLNNLSGLILCAGFAAPPINGVVGTIIRNIPANLLNLSPPEWAIRRYLVGIGAPAALVQQVKQTIARVPAPIIRFRLHEVLTYSAMKSVARVRVPALYIQASDDRLVLSAAFEKISSANSKVLHELVTGPHLLAQANPGAVAVAVLNFLHTLA